MLGFGLNQVTIPNAPFDAFVETAAGLGCVGVELRNDLGRPFFDGMKPVRAGERVRDGGLRLLGLSQVYPFNRWSTEIADEVAALIDTGVEAGAETISLIPCNDGSGTDAATRADDLTRAMEGCLPLLDAADMVALIEPLGFGRSSLRLKSEVVEAINALGAAGRFRLVHDTFHHTLAGGGPLFAAETGIVHISGVTHADVSVDKMEDEHRVLVDESDRLGNVAQITALVKAGYTGAFSFECFAPEVQSLARPEDAIRRSMSFISSQAHKEAA